MNAGGYLPLGCFGKLPFWREYLEHGARFPTSRALRRWMHDGHEVASLGGADLSEADTVDYRPGVPPHEAPPPESAEAHGHASGEERPQDREIHAHLRFVFGVNGSAEILVGVVRGSRDAGGRRFPFATFTHVPRKSHGKHFELLPLAVDSLWEVLDDAWKTLHDASSPSVFEERLRELKVPSPAPAGELKGIYRGRQQQAPTSLFDRGDGAAFEHLTRNVSQVVGALRQRGSSAPTVEVPVSPELDEAAFDASFWIDLINRQFRLRRFEPCLFIDARPQTRDRRAVLHYGDLSAREYPAVMGLIEPPVDWLRPAHPEAAPSDVVTPHPVEMTYARMLQHRFR